MFLRISSNRVSNAATPKIWLCETAPRTSRRAQKVEHSAIAASTMTANLWRAKPISLALQTYRQMRAADTRCAVQLQTNFGICAGGHGKDQVDLIQAAIARCDARIGDRG